MTVDYFYVAAELLVEVVIGIWGPLDGDIHLIVMSSLVFCTVKILNEL